MRERKPFEELTISNDIAQQCTSLYIAELRVRFANSILCRTTAIHGGSERPFS